MRTIYLDLDGTLLDVSRRYWRLHSDLVRRHHLRFVDRARFWELKRNGAALTSITGGSNETREAYWQDWLRCIEAPVYLESDALVPGVHRALSVLAASNRLVLATMRRNPIALARQLEALGLAGFFGDVLSHGDELPDQAGKDALIARSAGFDPAVGMVVGDTEADVRAGHALAMPSVAVTSGIRSERILREAGPTLLLRSVCELPPVMDRFSLHASGAAHPLFHASPVTRQQ
ncbi:MAG: HAD family hydrolase [Dehalococcoidia bacterium]